MNNKNITNINIANITLGNITTGIITSANIGSLNVSSSTMLNNVNITGNLTINGNTTLGDNSSDLITFNGMSNSNLNMNNKNISNINTANITIGNITTLNVSGTTPSTSTTTGALIVSGGVGIGGNLNINGTTTSTIFTSSDYRIKTNIIRLDERFTTDNLNPIQYTNKQNSQTEIGFLAHELQQEYPYLVSGEKDGETLQSVNYIGLIGVLVNEIKSLKARVDILEKSQTK